MSMEKATVYVVQDKVGLNFTPAKKFGELKFILPPGTLYTDSNVTKAKIIKELLTFCDNDYLVMTGDPEAMSMAYTAAMLINDGRVRILKWDNQEHTYDDRQHNWNQALELIQKESAAIIKKEEEK